MKCVRVSMVCVSLALTAWAGESTDSTAAADSSQAKIVQDEGANKTLNVPKSKTNWSKIKDLFM